VAALPGGLGRGGRCDGGPVGGGQVLPADGEAARGVCPREREGLVGRPARGRHAPAGGAGGGRRGRRGHGGGGGGPGGDGEAVVVEDGMDGAVGYNGGVPLRRQQVAVGARGRRWWAAAAAAPTAARGGTLTDTPRRAARDVKFRGGLPVPPFRLLLGGRDASGAGATAVGSRAVLLLLVNNVPVSGPKWNLASGAEGR